MLVSEVRIITCLEVNYQKVTVALAMFVGGSLIVKSKVVYKANSPVHRAFTPSFDSCDGKYRIERDLWFCFPEVAYKKLVLANLKIGYCYFIMLTLVNSGADDQT
jgi:hypothetical protein